MRWVLRIFVGLAVLLVGLVIALLIFLRIGPTGPVPAVDPIVTLNQAHADLTQNAAPLYLAAFECFAPPPGGKSLNGQPDWFDADEIGPRVAAWVDQNAGCLAQAHTASEAADCWFELTRVADGFLELPHVGKMRALLKLCRLRCRLAAARHDLPALEDWLRVTDRMARHLLQQPFIVSHLFGLSGLSYVQEMVLDPFVWAELSLGERAAYFARIKHVFEPPPTGVPALKTERDEMCWNPFYRGNLPSILMPPRRFAGEVDRYFDLYLRLAAQPPEGQVDPSSSLRGEIKRAHSWKASMTNPIRSELIQLLPSFMRALELRVHLIATQRGNRAAGEVFTQQREHGRLPESLDALEGQWRVDPYTGHPFFYRATEEGFILYSAGVDGDDDGGTHHPRFGERNDEPDDGDYVFWPLPERQDGR
jgi:hypothetical protein